MAEDKMSSAIIHNFWQIRSFSFRTIGRIPGLSKAQSTKKSHVFLFLSFYIYILCAIILSVYERSRKLNKQLRKFETGLEKGDA